MKKIVFLSALIMMLCQLSLSAQTKDVPYSPVLTAPDGTTCNLADLKGKVTYIDIWATWCGPCCNEIPYLEKVVEQFKGNDKIAFVSISVDANKEAWQKKLAADKPEWAQYILSKEEQKKFLTAWGIRGIPRFILLDKDGKVINDNCIRPSDPKLVELLKENL